MKVFCEKCKYFDPQYMVISLPGECNYPDNVEKVPSPDSWRSPGGMGERHIQHPSQINILNQCPWYKEK